MTIVLVFFVNGLLSFALGLLVAKFLGPADFGRYALAMAFAVVVNTAGFEWLRLSATRFYSEERRRTEPAIRATLGLGYAGCALALAVLAAASFLAEIGLGLPAPLLPAAIAAGIGMALFDYRAALARARFLDRTYARLVLVKSAAGFALMVGSAYLYGEPALVLAAAAVSAGAAILATHGILADPRAGLANADGRHLKGFALYALPLVAANVLYQLLPLLNRAAVAAAEGYAEAGKFALAADLGLRLFMILGSGIDILLFQLAVRTEQIHGRAEAERQIARNFATVFALLLPFSAGLWLVLPFVEALVVPAAYRGAFASYAALLIPALFAFALVQYALNPVFQLRQRTGPVILAALAALAVDGALLPVLQRLIGSEGVALAQVAGLGAAALCLATLALRSGGLVLPWRDLLLASGATAVMVLAILPLRAIEAPVIGLLAATAVGAAVYGGLAYACDIAGLGAMLRKRLSRGRVAVAPAA